MTTVDFVKMEGAGNDYIYVDAIAGEFPLGRAAACARLWSDRHFGIGADGLIVLCAGQAAPVRMAMWNADGSRGAMCGNGLRCLGALAFARGHVSTPAFAVETDAGLRRVEILGDGRVRTDMGQVTCGAEVEAELLGQNVRYRPGDAGNPHAVIFVADVERAEVEAIGRAMQRLPAFADGVNVEFVAIAGPDRIVQRTFERGSGETLACGTGAAVAALAARQSGRVAGDIIDVQLRGGVLRIVLAGAALAIEGEARTVYHGRIELPQ